MNMLKALQKIVALEHVAFRSSDAGVYNRVFGSAATYRELASNWVPGKKSMKPVGCVFFTFTQTSP